MKKEIDFNIGMVLDSNFPPDGRVEKEIKSLTKKGFKVFLLCFSFGDEPLIDEYEGATIIKIRTNRTLSRKLRALTNTILDINTILWIRRIKKFVENYKVDVLHIHDLYLIGAALQVKDKLNRKIQICGDLHENYADALKYYRFSNTFPGNILISIPKWKKVEREWISRLDRAVVVVKEMKQRISGYIDPEHITVLENCPEIEQIENFHIDTEIIKKFRGKFVISYIGAFDWHRGIDTLIKAVAELKDIEKLAVVLVGRGKNFAELVDLATKLGVKEKIVFEGWKPPETLPTYFHLSNIGVIPHLKTVQTDNSSPNKLYEYMYAETPVIATNCDSIAWVLNDTGTGLVYESGNSSDLAEKIRLLYDKPSKRQDMIEKGRKAVLESYNWDVRSKGLVDMYRLLRESRD